MTRPGIEPRSPGPLANTLTARPIYTNTQTYTHTKKRVVHNPNSLLTVVFDFFAISPISFFSLPDDCRNKMA